MMLNPMPAGRPEPQWTKYQPGSDFEDCEYRVEEMEILGVKNRYIMIRGTILKTGILSIEMPAGVKPYYPMPDHGFVITCFKDSSDLIFRTGSLTVNSSSSTSIYFNNDSEGSVFLLFARVR